MKSYNELKVNILEQTSDKSVVFTFGRFQPPTSGHQLLINKVIKEASKRRAEHRIYPSHSQDSKQNPLSHKDKVLFMRKMFSKANIVDDTKAKTPYHVLESLSKEGYKKVYFVVGGDRVSEFKNRMKKYSGKDGYNFDVIEVLSAGKRDPDAEGVVGMSGSKMRKAATDNDFEQFLTGVPSKAPKRITLGLFKAIRKGMGLKESYQLDEAKEYNPEKRRKLKTGEIEVMKGKGNRQKWFYLKNKEDVKQLIRLGRNSAFPTGITNNNSRVKFDKNLHIKESYQLDEADNTAAIAKQVKQVVKKYTKGKVTVRSKGGKTRFIMLSADNIDNKLRKMMIDVVAPNAKVNNPKDISYGNISSNIISASVDHWVKALGLKESYQLDESYSVVIVDDPQERAKGLMFETSLDNGKGMLFVFDEENYHGIWMKDTLIPLDVVWINENMEIVDIQTLQPHDLKGHSPARPARYVLEVNANTFVGEVGDILDVKELDTIQSLDESFENYLTELSIEARRKMSRAARRSSKRRARVRARKSKRMKSAKDIQKKSRMAAISGFKKKMLKGQQWSTLSHSVKANIEQRLKKKYSSARIAKVAAKLMPGIRSKERERIAGLRKKKKIDEQFDAFLDERNYRKEYDNYQGKSDQIERRSSRNKARRKMTSLGKVKFGDGNDVDHKDRNPLNNHGGNLQAVDAGENRSFDRTDESKFYQGKRKAMEDGTTRARKIHTDTTPGQYWWMQKKWNIKEYD